MRYSWSSRVSILVHSLVHAKLTFARYIPLPANTALSCGPSPARAVPAPGWTGGDKQIDHGLSAANIMPDRGEGDSGGKGGSGGKGVNRFAPYEYGKGKGAGKGKGKDKGKEKGKSKGAGKGGPSSAEGQVRMRAPALRAIAPATASAAAPL